jgi:hypothetical protein
VKRDGHPLLKVASRVGILHLPRQLLQDEHGAHRMPGNDLVPEHTGMVFTRGLREWVCLLPLESGFRTVQRLLGWMTHEPKIVSATQVREVVRQHAQELRAAEEREVAQWLAHPERLEGARARLVVGTPSQRKAAWPAALRAAVDRALEEAAPAPPQGISPSEWERVLAVRREEGRGLMAATLARIGPRIAPGETVATVDEVVVRKPQPQQFSELRTARLAAASGYRYLCGTGERFVQLLTQWLPVVVGAGGRLTVVTDGARWLEPLLAALRERFPECPVILDWYHLVKKCKDRISRLGLGRVAGRALWKQVRQLLWQGEGQAAIQRLEEQRGRVTAAAPLDELQQYLRRHEAAMPAYGERYRERRWIGSGLVEKANDLIVARRQKKKGMHWSPETSEALARLKVLLLNHEWDAYWERHQLPQLLAA